MCTWKVRKVGNPGGKKTTYEAQIIKWLNCSKRSVMWRWLEVQNIKM
jgi:hypothetical protein